MPSFPQQPTLTDLQRYVEALESERGLASQTVLHKCLLLGEEVGELFKAVREHQGMGVEQHAPCRRRSGRACRCAHLPVCHCQPHGH